ncbi:MAG: hypothetical protein EA397_19445 [Deltaproteobacteria bacterium]|nr:MAG: hypothetical protein EA397_19445 [Deltaproteobacteria bacterium]
MRSLVSSTLLLTAISMSPIEAAAVRPFVTDDARIVDVGQIETESWLEYQRQPNLHLGVFNVMAGATITPWIEILAGGGVGFDSERQMTVLNPVITPKFLFWEASEDGTPGLALAIGVTLPFGRGELFEPATGFYAFAPITTRLFDDALMVHANLGARGAYLPDDGTTLRPYWGLGIEAAVFGHAAPHLVLEAYSGDPFEALGPNIAAQGGFRWLATDYVNVDLTFGGQPEVRGPGMELWAQVGLRLLFDAFTPGGRRGDPMGATGAFAPPGKQKR